jgi:bifunctional DNA-binding transcriptional regulator/antitoxin component of YhaV-PrlF toxin-antitoxin module
MPNFQEVRTVTPDGRLIVPWVIQRALGLEQGGPVRFRVENGVVTLEGVEGRKPDAGQQVSGLAQGVARADGEGGAGQPRTDIRTTLMTELNTLLTVAERDRATETATS